MTWKIDINLGKWLLVELINNMLCYSIILFLTWSHFFITPIKGMDILVASQIE